MFAFPPTVQSDILSNYVKIQSTGGLRVKSAACLSKYWKTYSITILFILINMSYVQIENANRFNELSRRRQ